jgi:hypothetical protein
VGVEIVEDDVDPVGVGIALLDEDFIRLAKSSSVRELDTSTTRQPPRGSTKISRLAVPPRTYSKP